MQGMTYRQFLQGYRLMPYDERIGCCHSFYCGARDKEQLQQLLPILQEIVEKEGALENFRVVAKALSYCIKAKICAIAYAESEYDKAAFEGLNSLLDEALASLANDRVSLTIRRLKRLKEAMSALHGIMEDAVELALQVRDERGARSTSSVELLESVLAKFLEKKKVSDALPSIPSVFEENDFQMPDPVARVREDIDEIVDWLLKELDSMSNAKTEAFFRDHTSEPEEIADVGAITEHPALYLCNEGSATTVMLCSPFLDEVTLFLHAYAKKNGNSFLLVDAAGFASCEPEFLRAVFTALAAKGKDCLITGLSFYQDDNATALYEEIVRYSLGGRIALLHDTKGDRALYDAIYEHIKDKDGFSGMQVSYRFLRLPAFREVCEELEERGIVTEAEYAELREEYAFMGYVGLNRILYYAGQGRAWRDRVRELSARHERQATEYLRNIPSQEQLLDSEWRRLELKRDRQKPKREFDYDAIRLANPANIKKIMEADISLFAKCGMISKYCTLHGDDLSVWGMLEPEEMSTRLTEATRLVAHLLQNQYCPAVEVVPDEKWTKKRAGGLCCDGGKLIQYKEECCRDYAWTVDAICHECFHGFQHTLEQGGHLPWHWEELGVTENRVKQWSYNFEHYRDIDAVKINYMVQVVEADARAFAADCIEQSAKIYNMIDLE